MNELDYTLEAAHAQEFNNAMKTRGFDAKVFAPGMALLYVLVVLLYCKVIMKSYIISSPILLGSCVTVSNMNLSCVTVSNMNLSCVTVSNMNMS